MKQIAAVLLCAAGLSAAPVDSASVSVQSDSLIRSESERSAETGPFSFSLDLQGGTVFNPGFDSLPKLNETSFNKDTLDRNAERKVVSLLAVYRHELTLPHGIYFPTDLRISSFTLPPENQREFTPVEKYTTPSSILGYSGIGWKGPADVAVRGLLKANTGNTVLSLPWSPSQEPEYLYGYFKERRHVGYEASLDFPHERFTLNLHTQTLWADQLYENSQNSTLNVSNTTDKDWFLTGEGSAEIIDRKLMASGRLFHKDDLAEDGAYDLTFGKIGISTDTKIKKRLRFWGGIYGRAYDNRRMEERGYLNAGGLLKNIGVSSDLRTVWDLKRQFYIKGDLAADISNRMTKGKYDFTVRKMWRAQNISSQLGFWSTPGALFPRSCTYYSGSFGIGDQITVVPNARFYWQWSGESEAYKYDHTDLNLELNYKIPAEQKRIFTRMSFHGGIDCKLYDDARYFFSDQLAGYLGIRTYL